MSKGGGTTSTIDSRVFPLLEQNYKSAQSIAAKPFAPYTNAMVAPTSAATTQGQNAILGGALTAGQPALNSAVAGATNVQNFTPVQVKAPKAKATMGQAATSGVYGAFPAVGLMPPIGENAQGAPPPATAATQAIGFGAGRQARANRRAGRNGVSPAPTVSQPAPSTQPMSSGASTPAGPTVAAMQGLQGLDAYFNPYVGQVADRTLSDLDRLRQMSVNQNASNATLSSAFGGDRQAVTDALTNEAFARQAANTLAGLYSQGFDASSGLLMSDKDRLLQNQQFNAGLQQQTNLANMGAANQFGLANQAGALQAALANQNAGLQGAQVNLAGSSLLGNLANQQQQQLLTGASAVTGVGLQQQGQQQAMLNAAYQEFQRQQAYPYQQQQVLNSALGMFGDARGTQSYMMPNYTAVSDNYKNFGQGTESFANAGKTSELTVICTALARRGLIDQETLERADTFGAEHPVVVAGYRLWASPIARRIDRDARFASFIARLARPIIRKLATGGPDLSAIGLLLGCGVAICWALGVLRGFAGLAVVRGNA